MLVINNSSRIKRLDEVWDAAYNVVTSLLNKDIEEEKLRVSMISPCRQLFELS